MKGELESVSGSSSQGAPPGLGGPSLAAMPTVEELEAEQVSGVTGLGTEWFSELIWF